MVSYATQGIEGTNFGQIYTKYDSTAAISTTNDPAYPGFPFALGTEVVATDQSIWVFTQVDTSATLAFGNVCTIDPVTQKAKPMLGGGTAETTKFRVGFYQNSTSATAGQGCWLMVSGVPTITVAASCAKAVQLYTTDTSGVLDDAIATGSQYPVRNVYLLTTNGATASTGAAQASYPAVGPQTALL